MAKLLGIDSKISCFIAAVVLGGFSIADGQATTAKVGNNPYSPSPARRVSAPTLIAEQRNVNTSSLNVSNSEYTQPRSAEKEPLPTEIYKIGAGDVLYINLLNSPQGSGYYTVKQDGTIDYPLAPEAVTVAGRSTETVASGLASVVTLYQEPRFEVKVRQYASHTINVSGRVQNTGIRYLQRDAIPLFVIKAECVVEKDTARVAIKRAASGRSETLSLSDPKADETLIYPGDSLEFVGVMAAGYYYIAGEVTSAGQRDLTPGMTLYQAVTAAGGTTSKGKKAVIRRKDDKGILINIEYDVKSIRSGKIADPVVQSGDVVEIRK